MSIPKLSIAPKKYCGETTVVSMRICKELLKELDRIAAATGHSRNELLTVSLEFALEHMEIKKEEEDT